MKILITGSTGFIGQKLVKLLLDNDYEIHCIIRNNSNILNIDSRAKIFKYDEKIELLLNYFKIQNFDGVVHLASLFLSTHTKDDIPNLISSNIKFGIELLEACKQFNTQWFLNTGTFWQHYHSSEYNPVNLYAATKEAFKIMARYYTETSDLIFTTIKLNDTFGKDDTRNKIFNLWDKISKSGEVLEMSEGEQIIDICYIEDVVSAYKILISHLASDKKNEFRNKSYVVSSNEKMNLKDLSKFFEESTNTKLNIIWGGRNYREREVMIPYHNGQLVPYWQQKYSLKEAIKKTIGEE